MSDKRFAEWFEEAAQAGWPDAADFLTELRDAGFEVYRPDDCKQVQAYPHDFGIFGSVPEGRWRIQTGFVTGDKIPPSAAFYLVPVGSDPAGCDCDLAYGREHAPYCKGGS